MKMSDNLYMSQSTNTVTKNQWIGSLYEEIKLRKKERLGAKGS